MNDTPSPRLALTLIAKPGCHLCDDARPLIDGVCAELARSHPDLILDYTERSILEDAELHARFVEEIPVVMIGDRVHSVWHVRPERLRAALLERAGLA